MCEHVCYVFPGFMSIPSFDDRTPYEQITLPDIRTGSVFEKKKKNWIGYENGDVFLASC